MKRGAALGLAISTALAACSTTNESSKRQIKVSAEPPSAWIWQETGAGDRRTLGQGNVVAEQVYERESTEFSSWTWLIVLIAAPLVYIPINKGEADGYDRSMGLFAIPLGTAALLALPCLFGELGAFDKERTTVRSIRVGASAPGYADESATIADLAQDQLSFRLRVAEAAPAATPAIVQAARAQAAVVAVFDVQDDAKLGDPRSLDQLTEYLSSKLTEVAGYRVVPRDQLRDRLRERKVEGFQACYDESCQVELGKAVAAEKSLATKILRVGGECAMSMSLFDLRTETSEKAASIRTACSDRGLMEGIDQLLQKLRGTSAAP